MKFAPNFIEIFMSKKFVKFSITAVGEFDNLFQKELLDGRNFVQIACDKLVILANAR